MKERYLGEDGLALQECLSFGQTSVTDDIDIASFERLSLALEDRVVPKLG